VSVLKVWVAVVLVVALSACAADEPEPESFVDQDTNEQKLDVLVEPFEELVLHPDSVDQPLEGTEWVLESIFGQPVPVGSQATLSFDREVERVDGHTGCNAFTGVYELMGTRLQLSGFGLTRLACPSGFDRVEVDLLEAFRTTGSFRVGRDVLELMSETGSVASYIARNEE
jgi:heat shock protein HslJ